MTAPRRPVFETLRKAVAFRFRMPPAERQGVVKQCDARQVGTAFADITNEVRLVVTSPPYLDTTDYSEDQWLRLWFLGGEPRPELRKSKDDRYTKPDDYWTFLHEAWAGLNPLMADESTIVVRIGGAKFSKESLFEGLCQSFKLGFVNHSISPLHKGLTSSIRPRETSAFRPAPPRANVEHDFVFHLRRNDLVERDQVA